MAKNKLTYKNSVPGSRPTLQQLLQSKIVLKCVHVGPHATTSTNWCVLYKSPPNNLNTDLF